MRTNHRHPLLVLLMACLVFLPSQLVFAQSNPQLGRVNILPQSPIEGDEACLKCHANQAMSITLGIQQTEKISLFVNPDVYNATVHREVGLACIGCHVGFKAENGHGKNYNSLREITLSMSEICGRCHEDRKEEIMDSVHAKQLSSGNVEAAVCADCHSPHSIKRIKDPISGLTSPEVHYSIATTCEKCHSAIFEKYKNSVHGQALLNENNPDVPTCTDCHGVHSIEDPRSMAFRLRSPNICAKCHTDGAIMGKYGISTNVMNTYVSDFHGTTVTIFEKVSPDAATNKPVCYDCHGIHDIAKTDDPTKGLQIKQNLLKTCQKCHPDATANFPDSWTSHYIPDANKYPTVYYIDLFYKFFIPAVLGPMGLLVLLDFGRSMLDKMAAPKKKRQTKSAPSGAEPAKEADDAGAK